MKSKFSSILPQYNKTKLIRVFWSAVPSAGMPNVLALDRPSKKRSLCHERHYHLLANQIVFATQYAIFF